MIGNLLIGILCCSMGAITGNYLSGKLKNRTKELKSLSFLIDELGIKIRFEGSTLDRIIGELYQNPTYSNLEFLNVTALLMKDGIPFPAAFAKGIKTGQGNLLNEDLEILYSLQSFLGNSDIDGQIVMLKSQKLICKKQLEDAQNQYQQKGKMLKSVSTLVGIGVGIILL